MYSPKRGQCIKNLFSTTFNKDGFSQLRNPFVLNFYRMSREGKVVLEGLEFHAYHGIYPHERSSGNKFEVDVSVDTRFDEVAFRDDLSGTINYETVYVVVREEMEKPSKLLESVAHAIAARILDAFESAMRVEVTLSKFNPPIGGVCRKAKVSVRIQRNGN